MGILNRTPDSFSDGGLFVDDGAARARIEAMLSEGADIIDIGAESTRPGARPVPDGEQIARVGASVRDAAGLGAIVSIDTTSPAVAARALEDGAAVVNTVSLEPAAELGALCARHGAALALMHCRGAMSAMRGFSAYPDDAYGDVVADVAREWSAAAERAMAAGLPREDLILDPGLGFAKNARHSLELCARLDELCALGFPVLVGPSRKSFLARAAAPAGAEQAPPSERLGGTIAATLLCAARGAAIVRVHDVPAARQALAVAAAIEAARRPARPLGAGASAGAPADA
ncbi:MAG: dihydropteroate synthase [Polyangiaceae bacterium]|nr:dihydropteroate synthase [Polyangiaceae bacterium]